MKSDYYRSLELNFGITGTLVAKAGLNRGDGNDFLSRAHLVDEADVAIIFGGTNDYFWSDCPIHGEGEEYFDFAVKSLIGRVKEKRNGKITLFVTPYRHNGIGNFLSGISWQDASRHDTDQKNFNRHTLSDYVDVIVKLCDENSIPCLNLHEDFDFVWQEHTSDGCHPNEMGHMLIADAVTKKIKELIEKA